MITPGDGKSIVDLLTSSWTWLQDRRDLVRAQAQRLIDAFEAYGIAKQQIARVLPASVSIAPASFSTADKLKEKITPALLDWVADFLALNRRWLDRVEARPHRYVEGYKDEERYAVWLRERQEIAPHTDRVLYVWTPNDPIDGQGNNNRVCLVYVEEADGLDGTPLSRYWLLSDEWPMAHGACVVSMLKLINIAKSLDIQVIGRLVPVAALHKLETGQWLAPQADRCHGAIWYPEDMSALLVPGRR